MIDDIFSELENEISGINYYEDVEPTKDDWHQKRLGKLTASRFEDMMQNDRSGKKLGTAAMKYVYEKVAELLTNAPHIVTSQAMEWGSEREAEAISKYEEFSGLSVSKSDFVEFGEFAGGTPDGLVEDKGLLGIIEVKCPFNPANHVETVITNEVPEKYIYQIQGNMMVTDRFFCDYVSYDPRVQEESLRLFVKRVYRDEEIIESIRERIKQVSELVKELYEKLSKDENHQK
jgi:predicted phage-related endonuclease